MKIHCIGNPHIKEDNTALKIADAAREKKTSKELSGVEFIKCFSPDDIDFDDEKIIIVDVVRNNSAIALESDTRKPDLCRASEAKHRERMRAVKLRNSTLIKITDLSKLKNNSSLSCHDLDLGFHLQLLEKMGKLKGKKIVILGLPKDINVDDAIKEIKRSINKNSLFLSDLTTT